MSEEAQVQSGGEGTALPPADNSELSLREAANLLGGQRDKQEKEAARPRINGRFAPRVPVEDSAPTSQEADAAPPQEAPSETEEPDPVEAEQAEPSIEAPRSWTKEEKEAFRNLSPEHQKTFLEREQKRDKDIRSRLDKVAEQEKQALAQAQAVQQARQKYEQALPQLTNALNASHSQQFGDIRTQDDVDRLAKEDWPRWIEYQNSRQKLASVQAQYAAHQQQQQAEFSQRWQKWATEQDEKFAEKHPEFADKDKARKLIDQAKTFLNSQGYADDELKVAVTSYLRDARMQGMVVKAMMYDAAQANKEKSRVQEPAPKFQRPGNGRTTQDSRTAEIRSLEQKVNQLTGTAQKRAAADLIAARRRH